MVRPQFVTGEIYHIYNRGVERRNIVQNDKDRFRFIHDLFEFNDKAPTLNVGYHHTAKTTPRRTRKLLVEILCFCIMPNHYHFLIKQLVDNGITLFMRKLGTGYTNYFNTKYQRVGPLFQGKFKAVLVKQEPHLLYLPHYIHLNPLDLIIPKWRVQQIQNIQKALTFLESYRWSSYLDYINIRNFPALTNRDSLLEFYDFKTKSVDNYKNELKEWLHNISLTPIDDILIET
jgi:putative transposase